MDKKIKELEKKIKHLGNRLDETSSSDLAKEVDNKIDLFESQLKQIRTSLEERNDEIVNLKKTVEKLEKKVKSRTNTFAKKLLFKVGANFFISYFPICFEF